MPHYNEKFKRKAVLRALRYGITKTAQELFVNRTTISRWLKDFKEKEKLNQKKSVTKVFTETQTSEIFSLIKNEPNIKQKEIMERLSLDCTQQSLSNLLKKSRDNLIKTGIYIDIEKSDNLYRVAVYYTDGMSGEGFLVERSVLNAVLIIDYILAKIDNDKSLTVYLPKKPEFVNIKSGKESLLKKVLKSKYSKNVVELPKEEWKAVKKYLPRINEKVTTPFLPDDFPIKIDSNDVPFLDKDIISDKLIKSLDKLVFQAKKEYNVNKKVKYLKSITNILTHNSVDEKTEYLFDYIEALQRTGNLKSAENIFKILNSSPNDDLKDKVYIELARYYNSLKNEKLTSTYIKKIKSKNYKILAKAYTYLWKNQYKNAISTLEIVASRDEGILNNRRLILDFMICSIISENEKMSSLLKNKIKTLTNGKDKELEALLLWLEGAKLMSSSKYDDALNYLNKYKDILIESGDKLNLSSTYYQIGSIKFDLNRDTEAIEDDKSSMLVAIEGNFDYNTIAGIIAVGDDYLKCGDFKKAIEWYKRGEKEAIEKDIDFLRKRSVQRRVSLYFEVKKYNKVIKLLEKLVPEIFWGYDSPFYSIIKAIQISCLISTNKKDTAIRYVNKLKDRHLLDQVKKIIESNSKYNNIYNILN